jgi:hypothetical protein
MTERFVRRVQMMMMMMMMMMMKKKKKKLCGITEAESKTKVQFPFSPSSTWLDI